MRPHDPSLPPLDYRPGGWLGLVLEGLEAEALDDHDLVSAISACERQIAHLHAKQAELMAALSSRPAYASCQVTPDEDAADLTQRHAHDRVVAAAQEVGPVLSISPRQAEARVAVAVELVEDLPNTLEALRGGSLDWRRAAAIVQRTRALTVERRREVEAGVLDRAERLTGAQLCRQLDRAVMAADPRATSERYRAGRVDRRVEPPRAGSGVDGIAELSVVGPAEDVVALYTAVDAAARAKRTEGDDRTLDQLRFDAITGVGWSALTLGHLGCCRPGCADGDAAHAGGESSQGAGGDAGHAAGIAGHDAGGDTGHPVADTGHSSGGGGGDGIGDAGSRSRPRRLARTRGRPATVNVTLAFTTLTGLDDQPAHLHGYGPIPAAVGRRIAHDATLRRLLTDPADGSLLEFGRSTYAPPRGLVDHVVARDSTCRFPTCDAPARTCDLDHRVPWNAGGTTGVGNTHALSRRCHVAKTLHGWTITAADDGEHVWTSPAGHTHRVPREAVGPISRVAPTPPRAPRTIRHLIRHGAPHDPDAEPPPF